MQQWDYRLGINGVKRMQAAYNTALVARHVTGEGFPR
jgi:hypothetical protein